MIWYKKPASYRQKSHKQKHPKTHETSLTMESSKQQIENSEVESITPPTARYRLFSLSKHLQIFLVLAEFAFTILFIRSDASLSDRCIEPEAKTKLVIILILLQLIFGIVMLLNNCHKLYDRILLPAALSLVIYLNARYAYLYLLFVNIYYYREKQLPEKQLPECFVPLWIDLATLIFFHIFLFQLYFHLKALYRSRGSASAATSTTDKTPKLKLPSYDQVTANPGAFPSTIFEVEPAPAYQETMQRSAQVV